MTAGSPDAGTVKVWDIFVRIAHWSLVVAVLGAWVTEDFGAVHEWLGYAALVIITLRLIWGVVGTRYARFSGFVRSPQATIAYAKQMLAFRAPRYIGHNPLGSYMIVALIVMIALSGFSGWLYTTDRFWGVEWVEELHEAMANGLLLLIGLHVCGVVVSSLAHRENLVKSMVSGRKRAPEPQDVA